MYRVIPPETLRAATALTSSFVTHEFAFNTTGFLSRFAFHVRYVKHASSSTGYPSVYVEWWNGTFWSREPLIDASTIDSTTTPGTTMVEVGQELRHLVCLTGAASPGAATVLAYTNPGGAQKVRIAIKETGDTGNVGTATIILTAEE